MTTSLETQVKVLTAERDEYQKAAVRTAANCKFENDKLKTERDALAAAAKLALDALMTMVARFAPCAGGSSEDKADALDDAILAIATVTGKTS